MTEAPKVIPQIVRDPDAVTPVVINRLVGTNYFGSLFEVVLASNQTRFTPDGDRVAESVVCARLRFDLDMAKMLHSGLGELINALTVPADEKPN